jgi:hypothetical protein
MWLTACDRVSVSSALQHKKLSTDLQTLRVFQHLGPKEYDKERRKDARDADVTTQAIHQSESKAS